MNLKAVLEGLLYVCGDEGLTFEKALAILGISKEELDEIVKKLEEEYDSPERGIKLESFGGKLKLVTKKEHSDYYKNLFNEEVNSGLSQSALEVLAIIAYNEPVTRVMVDEIRGVGSAHLIRKLVFRNLIKEVGRSELPGRPILYGVTEQFLDYFGLKTTADLPEVEIIDDNDETDLFDSKYQENIEN